MPFPLVLNGNTYNAADFTSRNYARNLMLFLSDLSTTLGKNLIATSTTSEDVTGDLVLTVESGLGFQTGMDVLTLLRDPITLNPLAMQKGRVASYSGTTLTITRLTHFVLPGGSSSGTSWLVGTTSAQPTINANSINRKAIGNPSVKEARVFFEDFMGYFKTVNPGAYDPEDSSLTQTVCDNTETNFHSALYGKAQIRPADLSIFPVQMRPGAVILEASGPASTAAIALPGHVKGVSDSPLIDCFYAGICMPKPMSNRDSASSIISVGLMVPTSGSNSRCPHKNIQDLLPVTGHYYNRPTFGPSIRIESTLGIITDSLITGEFLGFPSPSASRPFGLLNNHWYSFEFINSSGSNYALNVRDEAGNSVGDFVASLPWPTTAYSNRAVPYVSIQSVSGGTEPARLLIDYIYSITPR